MLRKVFPVKVSVFATISVHVLAFPELPFQVTLEFGKNNAPPILKVLLPLNLGLVVSVS